MSDKEFVKRVVLNNEWLSGSVDSMDGDVLAGIEKMELFMSDPVKVDGIKKLYDMIRSYSGVFRYRNLFFFVDNDYGVFVYCYPDYKRYVEHLNRDLGFSDFKRRIDAFLSCR